MKMAACKVFVVISGVVVLAGCAPTMNTLQTTSGQSYLTNYANLKGRTASGFDAKVRKAANVEPTLRFPARIGLARIERGQLTSIPQPEAKAWLAMAKKLGARFGELVAISPMVAALASGDARLKRRPRYDYGNYRWNIVPVIQEIRLGAARQHVDVVLIYEVQGRSRDTATVFTVLDLSIIGAFIVPSRVVNAKGYASALLVDVRNGYPYGTEYAAAGSSGLTPSFGSDERKYILGQDAKISAVIKLTGGVEKMMGKLYAQLAARQTRNNGKK